VEGTHEQNEYRKYPETNFTLPHKRTKIKWMFNEELRGK
jgi:hypothetical protein